MSEVQVTTRVQNAIKDTLSLYWRFFLFQGVVMVILGCLALAKPAMASVAVDVYIGCLFLINGIVGLVGLFYVRDGQVFFWSLLGSALSMFVGVLLIWKPTQGVEMLTAVLAAYFVVEGIFQTVISITYRDVVPNSWGWMLFSGIVDLLLAAVIIYYWPTSTVWLLGVLVGVNLITSGIAVVVVAFESRSYARSFMRAAA